MPKRISVPVPTTQTELAANGKALRTIQASVTDSVYTIDDALCHFRDIFLRSGAYHVKEVQTEVRDGLPEAWQMFMDGVQDSDQIGGQPYPTEDRLYTLAHARCVVLHCKLKRYTGGGYLSPIHTAYSGIDIWLVSVPSIGSRSVGKLSIRVRINGVVLECPVTVSELHRHQDDLTWKEFILRAYNRIIPALMDLALTTR